MGTAIAVSREPVRSTPAAPPAVVALATVGLTLAVSVRGGAEEFPASCGPARGDARALTAPGTVDLRFEHEVGGPEAIAALRADADLVVAADGANSRIRRQFADAFGARVQPGRNIYTWLGTSKLFDAFTFAYTRTDAGWIWFHAYGYAADRSTFIVTHRWPVTAGPVPRSG